MESGRSGTTKVRHHDVRSNCKAERRAYGAVESLIRRIQSHRQETMNAPVKKHQRICVLRYAPVRHLGNGTGRQPARRRYHTRLDAAEDNAGMRDGLTIDLLFPIRDEASAMLMSLKVNRLCAAGVIDAVDKPIDLQR